MKAATVSQICPKCHGKGVLNWTDNDGGVCYKCEGEGVIGGTEAEIKAFKAEREKAGLFQKALAGIKKYLKASDFDVYAIDMYRGFPRKAEHIVKWTPEMVNQFEIPYKYGYEGTFNCWNPSKRTLEDRELLKGHFVTIEKISDNQIKIIFH